MWHESAIFFPLVEVVLKKTKQNMKTQIEDIEHGQNKSLRPIFSDLSVKQKNL